MQYNKIFWIPEHIVNDTLNSEYLGAIREHSDKRVYFYPSNHMLLQCAAVDSLEVLLYDFNIAIGDTITYLIDTLDYYDTVRYLHNVVIGIDSILINND